MKSFYYIILPLFLFIALSCRKDKAAPPEFSCNYPLDQSSSTVTIGDTTGMYIMDSTIIVPVPPNAGHSMSASILVWCADTNDVIITATLVDGPGPGTSVSAIIESKSGFEFLQTQNGDTTYWLNDTSYWNSNPVYMNVYQGVKTCEYSTSVDSIYAVNDKILYLEKGEDISTSAYYSPSAGLIGTSGAGPPSSYELNADTTLVIIDYKWDNTCINIAFDSTQYVGFKANIEGKEKLGWVEIKYSDYSGGQALFVNSIAIQR